MGLAGHRIGLIGHSHTVALLDALGPWRNNAGVRATAPDARYGEAFQGWFESDLGGRAFVHSSTAGADFSAPLKALTCLVTGGMNFVLAPGGEPSALLLRFVEQLRGCDVVVSALYGNELAGRMLINDLPPYDFAGAVFPSGFSWPDGQVQPIDRLHVREVISTAAGNTVTTLRLLLRLLPGVHLLHLLPPPPLERPEDVPGRELLIDALNRHGFVPPALRLKWHFAYAEELEKMLAGENVVLVRPPQQARSPGGFLGEGLREGLTHGNGRYGAMVWDRLDRAVG